VEDNQSREDLQQAAQRGDWRAAAKFAKLKATSRSEASLWYDRAKAAAEKAALDGDDDALASLAWLIHPEDPEGAIGLSRRAAQRGNASAMALLSILLENSEPEEAATWGQRSLELGEPNARVARASKLARLGQADAALSLLDDSGLDDNYWANELRGVLYGNRGDFAVARHYLERAIGQGSTAAMAELGRRLYNTDRSQAVAYTRQAAIAGDTGAMRDLARHLAKKFNGRVDALLWLEEAYRLGDQEAGEYLSRHRIQRSIVLRIWGRRWQRNQSV
jgi:hypothetical protein